MQEPPSRKPADPSSSKDSPPLQKILKNVLLFLEIIGLRRSQETIDQNAQVARLKLNHAEFRKLISANNSFLETMTDLEHKLLNKEFVDLPFLKRRVLRAIADIHTMVETLIVISNGRYQNLRNILGGISEALVPMMEESGQGEALELVMNLSSVYRSHADLAGGKGANLGEIRNNLGLPTPEGFVVTTEGFRLLIEEGGIRSWIQDKDMELLSSQDVERISQELQEEILNLEIPPALKEAIQQAYNRLAEHLGKNVSMAVRSSALGEDSGFSFAGQFLSLLDIGPERVSEAYLRVVASLYSPEAIDYRLLHGIPGQSAEMAVCFLPMVNATASGVIFSKDPNLPDSGQILIQVVQGLGVTLVDGRTSPEMISISNNLTCDSITRVASQQKTRLILTSKKGIQEELIGTGESEISCLSDEEVIRLGQWALSLEDHFGAPQDIEWARNEEGELILLQSRPLRLLSFKGQAGAPLPGYDLFLQGGETACPGIGRGIAVHLAEDGDLHSFPEGGVLIARRSSPRFVRLMNKAQAIVTDFGSTTGHMASLAREVRLPALLNTKLATQKIPPGELVTVDATSGLVYRGDVPIETLKPSTIEETSDSTSAPLYSPGLRMLKDVSQLIQPLNLTDPQSNKFTAENCRTLHDLARFIHEKSYGEMFMLGERVGDLRASATQLDVFLPIDLYLIDLGGGLKSSTRKGKVRRSEVTSVPLSALLDGMLHEKIPRFGTKSMDMKGLFSIMMRHAVNAPEAEGTFQDPCYAIISDNYLNYTARVGYHFSVVDTYCSNSPNKNYISLTFRGGAADLVRRARRTRTIAAILQENGFHIELSYDVINARLGKESREGIISHLKMLGSLLQFFRQMDAAMVNEEMVDQYKDAFLRGDYDFGQRA